MARRYSRDNRGRFASGGSSSGGGGKVGATARGGRLRTAAGNKRATQTTKAAAAKPGGSIAGKVKRNPAAAGKIGQAKAAAKPPRFSAEDAGNRKRNAERLKAMPKDLRRADRTARLAQREVMATNGAVGGNVIGRRRSSTQSKINSIKEGLMRAKGDKTGSIRSQVVKEAKQLRARMQTTAAGPRTGAQSGIKRQTVTAAKLKGTVAKRAAKPAAPKAAKPTQTKLGTRLNPAKKADRKATKAYDTAYNRENRIRTSLFKGNKSSEKKQAIIKELNKASNTTATMLMQRRGIRGSFPVQSKDKVLRAAAGRTPGTISKNKDVRNATNRKEAFKRRVTRAGTLSSTGANKKGRQTARTRAKALATYQGSRRPERSDSTVGGIRGARTSPSFKAPATRLGTPSRAARQQGKALSLAQTRLRDSTNRLIGNPKKVQRKRKTGQRALDFYKNPRATTEKVLKQRGNAGLSTAGFRKPRNMR